MFIGGEELKNALRYFKFTFHHVNLSERNKANQINPPPVVQNVISSVVAVINGGRDNGSAQMSKR